MTGRARHQPIPSPKTFHARLNRAMDTHETQRREANPGPARRIDLVPAGDVPATADPSRDELRKRLAEAIGEPMRHEAHVLTTSAVECDRCVEPWPCSQLTEAVDAVMPFVDELHERSRRMAAVANTFSDEVKRLTAELAAFRSSASDLNGAPAGSGGPAPSELQATPSLGVEDENYPCQLAVTCDRCGNEFGGDFWVNDSLTKADRLAIVRNCAVINHGWSCGKAGDFCPACKHLPHVAPPVVEIQEGT